MDIIFILQLLYRRIWVLILIPLFTASLTFFLVLNSSKTYKSTAQLATGFTTNEEITITEERFNIRDVGTKFSNLIEKISSPQVMSLVSYSVILHDLKSDKPFRFGRDKDGNIIPLSAEQRNEAIKLFQKKLDNFELITSYNQEEKDLTRILKTHGYYYTNFEKAISVKRVNFTDFLSVEYTSENPALSALVVNTFVNEVIRYEKSLRFDRSSESLVFFSSLMEKKKEELNKATHKLDSFKSINNVVDYKMESESKLSQITYYELKRDEEAKNIQGLQLSLANIENKLSMAGDAIGTNSGPTKNEKILELRKKINELNQIYINGGSKDTKLLSTIENLRDRLQLEMSNTPSVDGSSLTPDAISKLKADKEDIKLKLKIAESNLQSIYTNLGNIKGNISGYANKETALSNLQLEAQRAADEYADALDKYNVEKSKSMIINIALKPILMAQPAGEPVSNKTVLKTALAFFASFIICVVGVVMVEFFDLSIKTQAQFERMTKLELSGVLNTIRNTNNLNLGQVFSEDDSKPEHKTFKHLIRKIRYEIEKENSQVILVTSTQEKVGKSFLIVSLAYSLSLINKQVLVVDTNFKNNSLSKLLLLSKQSDQKLLKRVDNMKQLGMASRGEQARDTEFNSIISKTALRNVYVIGSNKSDDSPSEILSGRHFNDLLVDLRKNYDYIFFEGAALNNYSDTKELVEYVDKVLPVFSAETVIKESDKESIKFLRSLNGKIMGSVLNKVNEKDMKL